MYMNLDCDYLLCWRIVPKDVSHSHRLHESHNKTNVIANTQEKSGNLGVRREREGGRRERWRRGTAMNSIKGGSNLISSEAELPASKIFARIYMYTYTLYPAYLKSCSIFYIVQ